MAHGTPAPKGRGSFSEDLSQGVHGRPPSIFLQNTIRFSLKTIFPGNLPVPVIALGDFERGHEFLIE